MPRAPKQKPKLLESETNEPEKDSWGEDQEKREYYYDDAHGYETYDPEEEDEKESPGPTGPDNDGIDDRD